MSELMENEELKEEYEDSFSGAEKAMHALKLTSENFTRTSMTIPIHEIGFLKATQLGRKDTLSGLTETVKDIGVTTPIHVMTVPSEQQTEDYRYILLDGLRRVYAALKNGQTTIDATVWDFDNKDKAKEISLVLILILNRVQKRSWAENWDLYRILEEQGEYTPGTIEYLLQLEGGEAMKLKDVMLCEYEEVKTDLLTRKKTLDGAYKALQKLRKEEDTLARDDATGVDSVTDASGIISDSGGEDGQLSDRDVRELLEMAEDMEDLEDVSSEDFAELAKADKAFVDAQKVGERHPLDPAVRNAVLARDNFTCTCCGLRMVGARLGLIAVHHIIPVHSHGTDDLPNLTTLCLNCHVSLHIMERNGGSIMMSEEDYRRMPTENQNSLKRARKLAMIAIEADKRQGLKKKDIMEATQESVRHPMPGAGIVENRQAYALAQRKKAQQPAPTPEPTPQPTAETPTYVDFDDTDAFS